MGSSTWFRQYEVTLSKNVKLLLRRPFHLVILLLSSVISVIFAWLAGRDARGPTGEFPPLDKCGKVDPYYYANVTAEHYWDYYWSAENNIPLSLNEPWRAGLPVWLMSLGPTFAAISVFWILRDELNSRRWGVLRSAGLRDSAHWMSWFTAFAVLATVNSLLGGIAAKSLPNCHAFTAVNYGSVFGSLLFLHAALTTASFFLVALCGTCQSLALAVFIVVVIIVASAAPAIAASAGAYVGIGSYQSSGGAGAFWAYASTETTSIQYNYDDYIYNETTGEYENVSNEPVIDFYQSPIISYEESRVFGSEEENLERYSKEDFFQGCYIMPGASTQFNRPAWNSFFWFFVPQAHFMAAWSNILGYTSMPGNTFGFVQASQSPELLANEALLNYKGGVEPLYDEANTNGTSLFPQGSTVLTEYNYGYACEYVPDPDPDNPWGETYVCTSNCPPQQLYNMSDTPNTCANAAKAYPPTGGDGSPSFNDAVGYLFAVTLVYSILAAYWSSVFPMGNGSPMKFYFPILPSYWLGRSKKGSEGGNGGATVDEEEGVGAEDRDVGVGVKAVDVSKRYGKLDALKPLNLSLRKGEVTALLGHNGAGKSTFTNILCCEQNPTSGDVTVFGRSVINDKASVRHLIGECKQDDFLWPDLSAKEHLELFGGVRGLSKADAPATVQKWLESVDLDMVQNDYSSSFSGGMKRRLSLAIATVGDAPVVVLDEPTTGMDPVSRRFVWKHITEIKSDRVILLTTHAMEEADLLSDQVAILNEGNLVALGTPLELKSKYGSAIQFTLITDKEKVSDVEESIKEIFSNTQTLPSTPPFEIDEIPVVAVAIPATATFPTESAIAYVPDTKPVATPTSMVTKTTTYPDGRIVTKTESIPISAAHPTAPPAEAAQNVTFKSSQSGYITLTIKKIANQDETNDEGVPVTVLSEFIRFLEADDSPVNEFGISNSSLEEVFLAVTKHSTPNQARVEEGGRGGCCSSCFCCCTRHQSQLTNEADSIEQPAMSLSQPRVDFNSTEQPRTELALYERKLSVPNQVKALARFYVVRGWWSGKSSAINWIVTLLFASMNMINGFGMARMMRTGGPDEITLFFLAITVFVLSFMLILVISPLYHDVNKGLFKMMSTQSLMASSYICGISVYSLAVYFVYTFVTLTLFYGSSIFRDAIVSKDYYYSGGYNYPKFSEPPVISPNTIFSTQFEGEKVFVSAHAGPAGYQSIFAIIVIFTLTAPGSVLSSAFLPGHKLPLVFISIILLAACAAPAILMTTRMFDPFEFLTNCTAYTESLITCQEWRGWIPDEDVSSVATSSANAFVECAGWAVSNPYLLCTSTAASILPQFGLWQSLALTLVSNIVFTSEPNEAYAAEYFIPKLSAGGASCSGNSCNLSVVRNMYGESLGYMVLGGICLLVLGVGIVCVSVFPPRFIVNLKHRMSCSFTGCKRKGADESATESEELKEVDEERKVVTSVMESIVTQPTSTDAVNSETSNAPVLSYSSRNTNKESLPPVLMHKLRKEYPSVGGAPAKVALRSLDLHVEKGRVLGLLGKNGAGKTTALKIMAGMHDSSGGIGLVAGFDVEAERLDVYKNLGNCPQFDCVWDNQSVCRHLEFYARLKGIKDPVKAAKEIAVAVGLGETDVYTRNAANLSGGMRRRLSIAVSLLGSPNVLFLDEPTTGLDPSTRSEIWSLVSSFATPERAVIITTHMMLEADALCSRIAIVAKGNLKVVGTNQHLKDNYGSGYLLQLNLVQSTDESIEAALQFVRENINKDAKIVTKQAKTIHINLPRDVSVEKIFSLLYSDEATSCGINQFLVSQSSLEDVFIALGE
eukprot:CAMPEP_0201706040 /NCGR_PEP_ID=MMETSP0578-20130828/47609_1 /ASSEMBLY_ACC=CAM_ASM_000663 /TAXON_ID=267565 /ORGANISM="Skeletonema grethea, Strain CCMP 1804" /LENGTH=1815 /DNA_ID=CAMNT_0048194413 /DNA_START=88 /DNA_END=5535 /DNA_ORIENTATION=-